MWQKVKEWCKACRSWLTKDFVRTGLLILLIADMAFIICHLWEDSKSEAVTTMSQQQAETPTGIQSAADNANVKLDEGQAKEVSTVIREIRVTEKEPVYVIQTTGENAKAESEKAAQQEQADFAIVTDKNDTEKEVNLDNLDKDAKVELNQYNIQAFKKHLNTVEYQPAEKIIGYTHQWKVTDSGRYMGVGVDYDLDDKKVYAKLTYTW